MELISWSGLVCPTLTLPSVATSGSEIRGTIPEAIDTLARAVRAGQNFTTALEVITAKLRNRSPANSASYRRRKS